MLNFAGKFVQKLTISIYKHYLSCCGYKFAHYHNSHLKLTKFSYFTCLCLLFLVRSGNGLEVWNVDNNAAQPAARSFKPIFKEEKAARAMTTSENFFAYGLTEGVKVYNSKMELKFTVPRTKAYI